MINIIVSTHGALGQELINTTELIQGPRPCLVAVPLEAHEGIEDLKQKLTALLGAGDDQSEYLLLVDIFGGTPCNVALLLSRQYKLEVLAGVNLPMLLEALGNRQRLPLKDLAHLVSAKGQESIVVANDLLAAEMERD